jgi:hypothetical protein
MGLSLLIELALQGYSVAWFAPIYKMLAEPWRDALRILQPVIKSKNSQERRIELITGGVIDFWSLDNADAIRGRKYKRAIIDEAAMVKGLEDAWNMVIRPTLTDFIGDAYFLSTPKGANFFKRIFDWGQDALGRPEWKSWQMPTTTNPYIDPEEIEAARATTPEDSFTQEYLAQFLESAGGVFRKVREIALLERIKTPYPGRFVAGVDWGQSNDFTTISIVDVATRKMVDFDRFNQIDWELQYSQVKAILDKWQVDVAVVEVNSIGKPAFEALARKGLPVHAFNMTAVSKTPLIEDLVLAFQRKEFEILNDPVVVAEHEAYERIVSPITGRSKYSAPEGEHDDCVIATALSWYAVSHQAVISIESANQQHHTPPSGTPQERGNAALEMMKKLRQGQ